MTTLHLVSHTHWDREWYLTFQQFRLRLVHLMDHVLDLFAKDPGFKHFTLDGQAIVLEDYLDMRPEREAELREHLASGRLLTGPWFILPDEFLVSPEALIRNLLEGERITRRWGTHKMMVGYLPDTFGHIGQMPQILRGFKIETACLMRGLAEEPCELWWQAPDGSRVLLIYQRDGYGNAANLPTGQPDRFLAEVHRLRDSLRPYSVTNHILLMHGTDHTVPPADTGAAVERANLELAGSGETLIHSTLPEFIQAVRAEIDDGDIPLAQVAGELRNSARFPLLPGVLSTRMNLKLRNYACQTLLEKWAEPFSTWAEYMTADRRPPTAVNGGQRSAVRDHSLRVGNPAPILRRVWRLLLECHPHDSICGCSIDQVHLEMLTRFDQVEQIGEEITRQSLEILASRIDTRLPDAVCRPGMAIIVFNPACGPRTDLVEAEIELPAGLENFEIIDGSGAVLPHRELESAVHELFNMPLDREALRSALAMVQDGQVENLTINEVGFRRDGEVMFIDLVMTEGGEADLEMLRQGFSAIESWLDDETVQTFKVRARSALRVKLQFAARDLPESGFRTFWLRQASHAPALADTAHPEHAIENEFLRVEVSPEDGLVTMLDKRTGVRFSGMNRFVDGGDCGDEYNFVAPPTDTLIDTPAVTGIRAIHRQEQKAIEMSLLLEVPEELTPDRQRRGDGRTALPVFTRLRLVPGLPRLDILTTVDNGSAGGPARARDHRLRVHFAAPFSEQDISGAIYDGHFELVRRDVGAIRNGPDIPDVPARVEQPRPEKPQRAFTGIENAKCGLLVANHGLPEAEVIRGEGQTEIALTLLRCVGWLSRGDLSARQGLAGPAHPTPGAQMPGVHTFEYSVIPHPVGEDGLFSWQAYRLAYAFNAPLRAASTDLHPGELPPETSLVRTEPCTFIISTIKTAQDGSGMIVRGYNLTHRSMQVSLTPWRPFRAAERVDLNEQWVESLACAVDGSVAFTVAECQVATVKFSV